VLVRNYKDVPTVHTAENTDKRVVIGPKQGAPTFVMRVIEIPPGVSTYHSHDWEHEVFVLAGEATWVSEEGETPGRGYAVVLARLINTNSKGG